MMEANTSIMLFKNVAVHFNHFNSLLVFNDNVLQQILVFFIQFDEVRALVGRAQAQQFFGYNVVAAQGGCKVC
mgnify:CR=1 FL=1